MLTRQHLWDTQHRRKSVKRHAGKLNIQENWPWNQSGGGIPQSCCSPEGIARTKTCSEKLFRREKRSLCLIQWSRWYNWKKPQSTNMQPKWWVRTRIFLLLLWTTHLVYQALVFMKIYASILVTPLSWTTLGCAHRIATECLLLEYKKELDGGLKDWCSKKMEDLIWNKS